jgi:glycosyltransferase involved in cell wall biosynthesis
MIRLLEDPPLRDRLGKKASVLVRENYSWDAMADHHLSFYNKYC